MMGFNDKIEEEIGALDVQIESLDIQTDALLDGLSRVLGDAIRLLTTSRGLNRIMRASIGGGFDNDISSLLDEASIEKLARAVASGVEIGLGSAALDAQGEEPEIEHSFMPIDRPTEQASSVTAAPSEEVAPVKRGPGRPKKSDAAPAAPTTEAAPVKRGPGRPRKDGSPPASNPADAAPVKRGPGRPRKDGSPPAPAPAAGKRGPGRPRKAVDAPQAATPAQDEGQPSTAAEVVEAPMVAETPVLAEAPAAEIAETLAAEVAEAEVANSEG